MGTFERHFAGAVAEPATLPRANAARLADTGQGLEAAALAKAGEALTDTASVVLKWNEREGNSQFDTARAGVNDRVGLYERTMFENSDDLDAGFNTLKGDIEKLAPKNKSGARKFKAWTALNNANLEKMSDEKKIRMIAQNNQVALFTNLSDTAKMTDPVRAKEEIGVLIAGGLDDGTIKTASQALIMRDKFTENWQRVDVWRRATAQLRPDGEIDWTATADWFNDPENVKDLPENIVEDFAGTARSNASAQNAGDTQALESRMTAQRQTVLDKILSEDFTGMDTFVNATELSPPEKLQWIEKSESRADAINKDKQDPFTQTDGQTYFNLRRKIETQPGTVTEPDLAEKVGKGLSNSDYNTLLKMITDKDDPLNDPAATRAQASIQRMRAQEISILPTPREEEDLPKVRAIEDKYMRIGNEYDEYLKSEEGKKATDEQKQKKFQALTGPIREEIVLSGFQRYMRISEETPFADRIAGFIGTSEQRELLRRKVDALKDEGIWEGLSDADKKSARKALERGATVQQIIDSL